MDSKEIIAAEKKIDDGLTKIDEAIKEGSAEEVVNRCDDLLEKLVPGFKRAEGEKRNMGHGRLRRLANVEVDYCDHVVVTSCAKVTLGCCSEVYHHNCDLMRKISSEEVEEKERSVKDRAGKADVLLTQIHLFLEGVREHEEEGLPIRASIFQNLSYEDTIEATRVMKKLRKSVAE